MLELEDLTYVGPDPDDLEMLQALDGEHRALLAELNGFVAFGGGLHLRGACRSPEWHALRNAWQGPGALHRSYRTLAPDDVPFAQDALGDQYLLRAGTVLHLAAETGELTARDVGLSEFLVEAISDPTEYLGLHPLRQFEAEGGSLAPGQLLSAYPPFCTAESAEGVSLRAVPAVERMAFLARLAAHVSQLGDGDELRVQTDE